MFKRTKGYVLLTLVVITGFGGQIENKTLSTQERRYLLHDLKSGKKELIEAVKGLEASQIEYTSQLSNRSIRDYLIELDGIESLLVKEINRLSSATNDKETGMEPDVEDGELRSIAGSKTNLPIHNTKAFAKYDDIEDYVDDFKAERALLIKYVRTTTEDVREMVSATPYGKLDVYQMIMLVSLETKRITDGIKEIRKDPSFPTE